MDAPPAAVWAAEVRPDPSQGDVILGVLIGTRLHPHQFLSKRVTMKHNQKGWAVADEWSPDPETGEGYYVSKGRLKAVIVVSHSCDLDAIRIDKPAFPRILIAPVSLVSSVAPSVREAFETRFSYPVMKLGDVPGLGESYVDFRNITYVPYESVDFSRRIASLAPEGLNAFRIRLTAALARPGDY